MNDPASLPRVDRTIIAQIRELEAVRPGVLRHLIGMFINNTALVLNEIDGRILAGESEELRIAFHSLKGTAASLGAARLSRLAAGAESAAARDMDSLMQWAEQLRVEFAATSVELELALRAVTAHRP